MQMETVMILRPDDAKFIELIAEKVAEKLRPSLQRPELSLKQEKKYLTRKKTAEKLDISPPTVDRYVVDGLLTKLGKGKGARFRLEDVENLFENQNKYRYHHRNLKILVSDNQQL